jgi:hypothetical protein
MLKGGFCVKNSENLAVRAEVEILQSELEAVGVKVPMHAILKWKVSTRARAEQWAIHSRWGAMKRPPKHARDVALGSFPSVLSKWIDRS